MDEWHEFVKLFALVTSFWLGIDWLMERRNEKGPAKIIDFQAFKAKAYSKAKTKRVP